MRVHSLAMLAILTAAISTACGEAREVRSLSNHSNAWGCDQCHGYPPPPAFPVNADQAHPKGVSAPMCTVCHPATVLADGHTINATGTHRNGQVEAIDYRSVSCSSCHGTPPRTGEHEFHVGRGVACATCHSGYDPEARTADDAAHMNGAPDVILEGGYVVQTRAREDGDWSDALCAECHRNLPEDG